jgi:hypothetical protein
MEALIEPISQCAQEDEIKHVEVLSTLSTNRGILQNLTKLLSWHYYAVFKTLLLILDFQKFKTQLLCAALVHWILTVELLMNLNI